MYICILDTGYHVDEGGAIFERKQLDSCYAVPNCYTVGPQLQSFSLRCGFLTWPITLNSPKICINIFAVSKNRIVPQYLSGSRSEH